MPASDPDPFNLARFLQAQQSDYATALGELRAGRKRSHWMWYILPQLRGLGLTSMANFYGIASLDEARAYLAHPVLGARLKECVAALNALEGPGAVDVLGLIDAAKFRSCLTLFAAAGPGEPLFEAALRKYYGGVPDAKTLALLDGASRPP